MGESDVLVGIVMGSDSDWPVMQAAGEILTELGVAWDASVTPLPVIGVPVPLKYLDGMDSLLSIVQMPGGIPVATVAIGNAKNAGILAARILATSDPDLQQRLVDYQDSLAETAHAKGDVVRRAAGGGRRVGF
jgi:5-(carboxyamino)imidazole ribonucleotide mutase